LASVSSKTTFILRPVSTYKNQVQPNGPNPKIC
jgi:hypothetical protein